LTAAVVLFLVAAVLFLVAAALMMSGELQPHVVAIADAQYRADLGLI
jgi:hypothetical protein